MYMYMYVPYCQFLQQLVGHKEVQSWVNGKIECLHKREAIMVVNPY